MEEYNQQSNDLLNQIYAIPQNPLMILTDKLDFRGSKGKDLLVRRDVARTSDNYIDLALGIARPNLHLLTEEIYRVPIIISEGTENPDQATYNFMMKESVFAPRYLVLDQTNHPFIVDLIQTKKGVVIKEGVSLPLTQKELSAHFGKKSQSLIDLVS